MTVRVNYDSTSSSPEKVSPDIKGRNLNSFSPTQNTNSSPSQATTNSSASASTPQSQTLSDLKKQRSMSRVKHSNSSQQQETSPSNNIKNETNSPNSTAANVTLTNHVNSVQNMPASSKPALQSPTTDSPSTLLKTSSSRKSKNNSTSRKSKSKAPTHPKAAGKSSRSGASKHQHENSDDINIDRNVGSHHSQKKFGARSSTGVKKFSAATNEVVGPPQKRTGCCKVM